MHLDPDIARKSPQSRGKAPGDCRPKPFRAGSKALRGGLRPVPARRFVDPEAFSRNIGAALLFALVTGGCASVRPHAPAAAGVSLAAPASAPAPPSPDGPAQLLYRPPKIARIYLRAHEDANGRLVGPQVIYQIIEPGGWNLDALERTVPEPERVIDPSASWFLAPDPAAK